MRKLLVLGALALAVTVLSQQQASAWCHCKFGVGVNLEYQGGGNNWFWGAMRTGQVPGYPDYVNAQPNCPAQYAKNYNWYGPPGPGCCPNGQCVPPGFGPGPGPGFGPFGYGGDVPGGPNGFTPPAPQPIPGDGQAYYYNAPTYSNVNFQPSDYAPGGFFMPVSGYNR